MQLITLIANLRRQTFVLKNIWEYQQIFEQLITLIGNLWRTMLIVGEFLFFSRKENTIRDRVSTALYAAYTVYTVDTVDTINMV